MPFKPLTGDSGDLLKIVLPAASRGRLADLQQYLKAKPAFLNAQGPHGRTILWEAARKGHEETVAYLIEAGAKLNVRGCYFRDTKVEVTPWCVASMYGRTEVAALLAAAGAEIGLDSACMIGDAEQVERRLQSEPALANAVFEGPEMFRTIHYAVASGDRHVVRAVLAGGADAEEDGGRLLSWAFGYESPEIAERLLAAGARPRPGDANEAMLDSPHWEAVLPKYGVKLDINAPDRLGFPPLIEACRGNHNASEDLDGVKSLVARGADVRVTDHKGKTALHRAAQAGFVEIITYLIAEGASIEAADNKEETPLFDAVRHSRLSAVQLLCAKGARAVHQNRLGQTAMDLANRSPKASKPDIIRALLDAEGA